MIQQGTDAWHVERLGKATASKIQDIIASGGKSAGRKNYCAQLVTERLTGKHEEGFRSTAMDHGNETEAHARMAYAFLHSVQVSEAPFVNHPEIAMTGASPDGFVGDDGLIEIKCPNTATHIATLMGASIPAKYDSQMRWQMACTGRAWCDFVSFDPRLPESMRMHAQRVHRCEERNAVLEREVRKFLSEVDEMVDLLNHKFGTPQERAA